MGHEHNVRDLDARFTIDPVTKQIKNESKKKLLLAQGDHNSEIYGFRCPRYIESHDMSLCNKVEVHFFNYESQTKKFNSGKYEVKDLQVGEDEDTVEFSWLISGNGTQLEGYTEFLIRFKCVDENNIVTYAWNTLFFSDVNVGRGSTIDELFETEYVDIIEQWKAKVMQTFKDDLTAWKTAKAQELAEHVESEVALHSAEWNQKLETESKRIDAIDTIRQKKTPKTFKRFVYPNGFAGTYKPIGIYWDGENFITDFKKEDWMHSGGTTYYVSVGGTYLNDGLTREKPVQLYQALTRATDGDTIIITEGLYSIGDLPLSEYNLARSVNIIGEGTVVLAAGSRIWEDFIQNENGLWVAVHPLPVKVLNINNFDITLSASSSVRDCQNTSGSYYHDGTNLYVNTDYNPNGRLLILHETMGFVCNNTEDCRLYMENITIVGGASNFHTSKSIEHSLEIIMNKCNFLYSLYERAAVRIAGGNALMVDCKTLYSQDDGFGYVAYNSNDEYVETNFVEINCIGANNGLLATTDNKNGSTAHSGIKGIRVNGLYYNNNGGNVADVQEGTQTVNLGCEAYDSVASEANQGFGLQQAGTTMWLYNCKASGNNADLVAYGGTTAYIHKCHFDYAAGGGTIIEI